MDICRVVSHGPFCSRPRLSYHKLCLAFPQSWPSDSRLQKRSHFSDRGNTNVGLQKLFTLWGCITANEKRNPTQNYFELSRCLSQEGLRANWDSTGHGRSGPGATANKTVPARRATFWPDSTAVMGQPPVTSALSLKKPPQCIPMKLCKAFFAFTIRRH